MYRSVIGASARAFTVWARGATAAHAACMVGLDAVNLLAIAATSAVGAIGRGKSKLGPAVASVYVVFSERARPKARTPVRFPNRPDFMLATENNLPRAWLLLAGCACAAATGVEDKASRGFVASFYLIHLSVPLRF